MRFNATRLRVSRGSCGPLSATGRVIVVDPVSGIEKLDQLGLRTAANHLVGHVRGKQGAALVVQQQGRACRTDPVAPQITETMCCTAIISS